MRESALASYRAAESPLKRLGRQRSLSNFKTAKSIRLGEMGRLEELGESGEITHTSRAENGETTQRAEAWSTLGLKFRAWLDFGARWLDWRAAFLNEGTA
ncbi:hypothetical protein [Roseisalinus antarcticus]|uniref:Uncharacterized protein n=1 Tax=Roseisalinus antarcticus TaxID=254357 RepID=A0A1Y5TZH8_9RHOB|nr:hypothetical protein [Roseisalinus antarcticus]SLN77518.1 hypothetical protein ROA7023_04427 [Roseisalinus antarcticus]